MVPLARDSRSSDCPPTPESGGSNGETPKEGKMRSGSWEKPGTYSGSLISPVHFRLTSRQTTAIGNERIIVLTVLRLGRVVPFNVVVRIRYDKLKLGLLRYSMQENGSSPNPTER